VLMIRHGCHRLGLVVGCEIESLSHTGNCFFLRPVPFFSRYEWPLIIPHGNSILSQNNP
jgi:hypothetical protein